MCSDSGRCVTEAQIRQPELVYSLSARKICSDWTTSNSFAFTISWNLQSASVAQAKAAVKGLEARVHEEFVYSCFRKSTIPTPVHQRVYKEDLVQGYTLLRLSNEFYYCIRIFIVNNVIDF